MVKGIYDSVGGEKQRKGRNCKVDGVDVSIFRNGGVEVKLDDRIISNSFSKIFSQNRSEVHKWQEITREKVEIAHCTG